MAVNNPLPIRDATAKPPTNIAAVSVFRDDPRYIEKSIRRLAVLEDVRQLKSPAEIRQALDRWEFCLFRGQAEILRRWLNQARAG